LRWLRRAVAVPAVARKNVGPHKALPNPNRKLVEMKTDTLVTGHRETFAPISVFDVFFLFEL